MEVEASDFLRFFFTLATLEQKQMPKWAIFLVVQAAKFVGQVFPTNCGLSDKKTSCPTPFMA